VSGLFTFDWADGSDAVLSRLGTDGAVVDKNFAQSHTLRPGSSFRITSVVGKSERLRVLAIYKDPFLMSGFVTSNAAYDRVETDRNVAVGLVRTEPGADVQRIKRTLKAQLAARFPDSKVQTNAEYKQDVRDQLNQLLNLLYALLAMSVVISLFGIANTLFLAIHERTRELGLLRAIGATAGQVRRLIRLESVITSVIGGLLGTGVGLLFAWLTTFAFKDLGVGFVVPVAQMAVFLVLAVLVGAIGAIAPARRASRLDILDAIHSE
jgi:putative ABC transport system permease protein